MRAVVVLGAGATLASVGILGQHAIAHRGTALESKTQLAPVAEVVYNIVAVDRALFACEC